MSDVATAVQRWQRVKSILADALEFEKPKERTAFLEGSCDGDTTLLREVEALLAQAPGNFDELSDNTPLSLPGAAATEIAGERIGAYEIIRELGRGGMGAVYLAKRADGQFDKEVAIKLLKRGTDTDEVLRRFREERRILARLDHPNIARLLDAGTTKAGLPYFVMEYVAGLPITRYVANEKVPIAGRLELFLKVCAAVQFAHQHQIVHRDLKPGNIVVTPEGEPKLLDFGIAKLLTPTDDTVLVTRTEQRRLTPACASPEQARGEPVTPASDVYALGALLYELLTDKSPHRFATPQPTSEEIARVICNVEPSRPSLAATSTQTRRQLGGDLDKIVLMSLRKEPARRYSSVADFAEDIRRHIQGRAIRARPNTVAYVSRRFLGRQRYPISALVIVTALGTALGIVLYSYRAELKRRPPFLMNQASTAIVDKSIAVLPFENLSDDKANSFFADGMQDEILTDLAKVADLKVISRTSAMQYRMVSSRNLREIGRQLGVAHILEGSVQRVANRIRVSAQLIDARTDAHLWAEHYDRDASDVFAIQNEIAKNIAEQLRAKISPNEQKALEEKPTSDLVAYDLYLRATAIEHGMSTSADWVGDIKREIELLDRAVTQDPNFALAYCLLTKRHLTLYDYVDSTAARLAMAEAALQRAIQIAPNLGQTYLQRASMYRRQGNLVGASEMVDLAAKALPGSVEVLVASASIQERLGHWSEAVRDNEKALALDPRGPNIPNHLEDLYTALREYAKADEVADAAIAAFPNGPGFFLLAKGYNALRRGDRKAAEAALAAVPSGFDPSGLVSISRIDLAMANRDYNETLRLIEALRKENLIEPIAIEVAFFRFLAAERNGDTREAKAVLLGIRAKAEAELRERPAASAVVTRLARIDAYLGRIEDALRESEHGVELTPISRDAINGPMHGTIRAEVLMRAGQRDRAIELLLQLAKVPYGPSYGDLLGPRWDALRGDPRFAQIVEESARPIDLTARSDAASNAPTKDLVAYDLFLRGQAVMNDIATSTDWEGDNRRAIDLFERAVTHDPKFALAYAQLVGMHVNLYVWVDHTETRLAQAKAALEQAERLAPDSADTYAAAGELAYAVGDTNRALERFGLAHRARPNDDIILSGLAQAEENLGKWDDAIRDMEKARKIAPRNSNIPNHLKGMYAGRRDYGTSDHVCDEAIAQFPNGPIYYRAQKVSNSLDRGDSQQAHSRLAEIPEKFDASGYRSLLSLRICLAERDYDHFSREFANLAWDRFIEDFKLLAEWTRVLVAEREGDRATIESLLIPRREKVAKETRDASHTDLGPIASRSAKLARIDSYLGRTEEALRESEEALANATDPVGGPTQEIIRAEVLMRAGQTGAALEILERIARVPYGPSYGELLGLRWDKLRANPRFVAIVEQLRKEL